MKTSLQVLNIIYTVKRINKCRTLSLQEVELEGWIIILHIVLETCTIQFMHKFNMRFIFHFYILGLMSWIWTSPSTKGLKFESPSKWNSYEGFNIEHSRCHLYYTYCFEWCDLGPFTCCCYNFILILNFVHFCYQDMVTSYKIWVNQPIHLFLVGCLKCGLQRTSVRVVSPQPMKRLH